MVQNAHPPKHPLCMYTLQPLKTLFSIIVIELGIVIDVKLLQSEKAPFPILVTEFGMVTDVKPLQL